MGATLAAGGVNPITGERAIGAGSCRRVLAVLATSGLYECSGDWLYDVGLPGKSGVSGGTGDRVTGQGWRGDLVAAPRRGGQQRARPAHHEVSLRGPGTQPLRLGAAPGRLRHRGHPDRHLGGSAGASGPAVPQRGRPPERVGQDRGGGPTELACAAADRAGETRTCYSFGQCGLDLAGTAECTRGCPTMFLEESPEQQQLRAELRGLLHRSADRRGTGRASPRAARVVRPGARWCARSARTGWLGIGWPVEFGGQGRPATDQFIFFDEIAAGRARRSPS